jgi:hypothetical protein
MGEGVEWVSDAEEERER